MKRKDPIKALEILRDWNKECADRLFKPLEHDWPQFYKLTQSIGDLFVMNQKTLDIIIAELQKRKKNEKRKTK